MNTPFAACTLAALAALTAAAQQPRLVNAKIETRSAAGGLESAFRAIVDNQSAPAWIGYAVPMIPGERNMCCYGGQYCCGGCGLESGTVGSQAPAVAAALVRLEPPGQFFVLFRIEQRKVDKIRHYSVDCELDAGGVPFHLLTDVRPAESVALLAPFVAPVDPEFRERRRLSDAALSAIALHRDPAADQTLDQFVAADRPENIRERAAFWLGSTRGRRGYEVLARVLRDDPSDRVRDKALHALSVSKEPQAIDTMIDVARNDRNARIRGQALFWLAHKAGKKAEDAITEAIARDPEAAVKKRAVFALSQLPKDESVRLLIEVARTNRNPLVQKEAIQWLGRSRDPRALDYLEKLLGR